MSGIKAKLKARKYVPNLPDLQARCEVNYARLLRLLPDCDTHDLCYRFKVNRALQYEIRILDSSRYTSTVSLAQIASSMPAVLKPQMKVRLYHDAQMAEVLSAQNLGRIKPSYPYPNKRMHQKNEKEQVNRFLSEWLSFCLAHHSDVQASVE